MHTSKQAKHLVQAKRPIPEASLRQRKVEQTLARVVQVAWQMFESEGYEQVSMEAIGTAADLAKATLYKYFPCKEAILEQHFKAEMRERKEEVQVQLFSLKGYQEKIAYLFQLEASYLQDKHRYLAPLLRYRMQKMANAKPTPDAANLGEQSAAEVRHPSDQSGMLGLFIHILQEAQHKAEIPKVFDAETLAHYLNAMRSADLFHWLANPDTQLNTRHKQMLQLFFNGVNTTQGLAR